MKEGKDKFCEMTQTFVSVAAGARRNIVKNERNDSYWIPITMMTSREFRRLVVAVSNGYAAADKRVDAGNREEFLRHGKWALGVLKRYFHDTDRNIERWLQGEKCVFIGAATKAPTEIQIGNDLDAFFYFMQFYKMQKEDRKPDEDFIDYMALLITRSQSKEWEEC